MAEPWNEYKQAASSQPAGPWDEFKAPAAAPKLKMGGEEESPGFVGAAVRGFKRSLPETKSLLYGGAAALGGAVGAEGVRDWGLENYERVQREEVEPLANKSGFQSSLKGDTSLGEWAGDTIGNFGGQALQSVAAAGAGAAVGSVLPGAGTAAGAVGGVVARGAVKKGVEVAVKKLVENQVKKGVAREVAEQGARQSVLRQLGGAALAGTGLNVGQETGIAFTGRAADAAAAGEGLDQGDALRAIGWGVPAGLVDTAAEAIAGTRLLRGVSGSPSLARRVLGGAAVGAATEGGTEAIQAAMERAGAGQEVTGEEAVSDYIENAAAGALGGSTIGGASGVRRARLQPDAEIPVEAAPAQSQPAASVAPAPVLDDGGFRRQLDEQAAAPRLRFPDAAPGSLADTANALDTTPAATLAAVQAAEQDEEAGATPAKQPKPKADANAPASPLSNMDPETGEMLSIDAEAWPGAAAHNQPRAIVESLKNMVLEGGRPIGVTAISKQANIDMDTARALRKRALAELHEASVAAASTGGDVAPASASLEPAQLAAADEAPAAPAALGPAPAAREAAEVVGEAGASPSPPIVERAQDTPVSAEQGVYDESAEQQEEDIGSPSGGPFTIRDAALRVAGRTEGGKVYEVDGGFVVRTPSPATEQTAARQAAESRVDVRVDAPPEPQALPSASTATTDQVATAAEADRAELSSSAASVTAPETTTTVQVPPAASPGTPQTSSQAPAPQERPAPDISQEPLQNIPASALSESASSAQPTPPANAEQAAPGAALAAAAAEAAPSPTNDRPEPTAAQKEAGNYKKGHARVAGLDVSIENPAGTRRRPEWPPLKHHYGYIKGTIGKDKDHVDVFMTDHADDTSRPVFVVDQVNRDGAFDEHKVVLGAADEAEARAAYLANYGKGWKGLAGITQMSQDEFRVWVKNPAKTKRPASALPAVKKAMKAVTARKSSPKNAPLGPKAPRALFSKRDAAAPTFYSALVRALEQATGAPKRAPGSQWLQWFDGAQRRGEIKQEERAWMGVDDWLQGQESVTRDQVLAFVRANSVQVQDVQLDSFTAPLLESSITAADLEISEEENQWAVTLPAADGRPARTVRVGKGTIGSDTDESQPEARALAYGERYFNGQIQERNANARERAERSPSRVKFASYQLPGGENYRELLLTLPRLEKAAAPVNDDGTLENFALRPGQPTIDRAPEFRSGHFEQPNILAHVRFNERTDAAGKKVLFLEEVQSDWHQAGRKGGYGKKFKVVTHGYDTTTQGTYNTREEAEKFIRAWDEANPEAVYGPEIEEGTADVPDAPFKTTWPMLAMKRMVRYAADNGFDRIAWTTGDQQAARYDLSKVVDEINYNQDVDGGTLIGNKEGASHSLIDKTRVSPEQLAEYIGKEAAEKLMAQTPNERGLRTLSGVDLKVGGEGMKGFYDKILPAEVNKFAKRFGGKVGVTSIVSNSKSAKDLGSADVEAVTAFHDISGAFWNRLSRQEQNDLTRQYLEDRGTPESLSVHAMDITPAMRDAALLGLPMFSKGDGSAGGLGFDRALQLKQELTAKWGENAPNVVLVEDADGFPDAAKLDPEYRRGEGFFGGKKTVWLNVGMLRSEKRFAEVLAHEALGHFGVEQVVGAEAWAQIRDTITRHDRDGSGAPRLREVMAEVHRKQPGLDQDAFAREVLAFMAEKGMKGGLIDRVIAAVRRFLRQIMPGVEWSEADLRGLLGAADNFLRAGTPREERQATVRAYSFSRRGWSEDFPDAVLGVPAGAAAAHPDYDAAKAGDDAAAFRLARDLVSDRYVDALRAKIPTGSKPIIVPVLAQEASGRNRVPAMVAAILGDRLNLPVATGILQANQVSRSGADGFHRLANQPRFVGPVQKRDYLILDDTLTQGGTLAELKTHIEDHGGRVLLATALTGKQYGATMAVTSGQLANLRERFGSIENWWRDTFGYGFEGFTQSEARFLLKLKGRPDADAVRARIDGARVRGVDQVGADDPANGPGEPDLGPGRFSKAYLDVDGRGRRTLRMGDETFAERSGRFYMVNGTGEPKDFRTMASALEAAERTGGEVLQDDAIEGERPTWSVVAPDIVAREAQAQRGLFSKAAPADILDDIEAIMNGGDQEGLVARARAAIAEATPKKIKDQLRSTWLGALTTRHLTELGADYFENIKHYSDFLAQQGADRNQLQAEGEAVAEAARQWAGKNRAQAKELFGLMHDATIDGVDPATEFKPLQFRYSGQLHEANRKNVKDALVAIRQQMRERGGDSKKDMMLEAKAIRAMPGRDRRRREQYPVLVERWNRLTPEAQQIFRDFRDLYEKRSDQVEEGLIARINDTDAADNQKRKIINVIRQQFETARLQGIYFPLQRFGEYFVSAERDGVPTFLMFERLSQLEKAVKDLRSRGFKVTAQGKKQESKSKDAPSGTFVAEVIDSLHKAGVSEATQDDIYQLYLQALPELSMRKHSIHRKAVPGFDPDAVRAFAFNMHHGAHQLARLRFSHKLQNVLDVLKKQQDAARKEEGGDTRKIAAGDAILDELGKRHQWIMNPQDSALTNLISSFGFVYYLGLTPAAALVNLTQTALVSYPFLAARYGGPKAMNYLLAGMRDSIRTMGNIQKTLTDPDERRAHDILQTMGALDKTQAHNLAGIAEGGLKGYNPAWSRAMEIIGWGFHKTEVVNREATGLAAFRLARGEGKSFDEAVRFAAETINQTHFDYTNANRARFMQSGTAKTLLMFRQYSLNMTWHLGRMLWKATKDESPEVRRIARRNLAGILGMSSLFSGVLGLPLMSVTMGVLNAIASSFGDDDEPWDAETEFRKFLIDMLGAGAAETLLTGVANKATGADIASRVSLSQLWIRDADRELDGRGAYYNLLEQAAGPMGGVLKNALVGKHLMDEGHLMRGFETMLPKSFKDMVKAARYGTEGVNNLRGDPIVEDPGLYRTLLQLGGFTPAKVADRYDTNRSLKNYEQHILDRRQHLMDGFAMALRMADDDARADALDGIRKFNRTNPEIAITPESIRKSLGSRARYSAKAEAGIVLNTKLSAKVREAVGAE